MTAQTIVKLLLERGAGPIQEGTIIILNGDGSPENLGNLAASGSLSGISKNTDTQSKGSFSIQRKGKNWRFAVNRDERGQIDNIFVSEEPS